VEERVTEDESVIARRDAFLSLAPASRRARTRTLALIVIGTAVFFAAVPLATVKLRPVAGFIPAYQAALCINDLITAAVLYGQFSIIRSRALLLLSVGYLFTAIAIVPHTLSFPGLFAPGGLMGSGPQTTAWLYMFWHAGFPLLVIAYAFAKADGRTVEQPRRALLICGGAALAAVVLFVLLTTWGHGWLPEIMAGHGYAPAYPFVVGAVWLMSALALLVLWLRPPHSVLDLWMMVVMTAWIFDVGLSAVFNAGRFDLGFYLGRFFGLVAASYVLIMLLNETRTLYVRLARSLMAERAAAESRATESAEAFRAVVDGSSQAIIALSPGGEVLLWNRTAEQMFGYRAGEVLGKPFPLMTPGEEASLRAMLERATAGETLRGMIFQCRRADGSLPDIRGSVAPYRDATVKVAGLALALEDVTEQLATEAMLRQAQKMEAIGQLTGGVAHDFNNILMVVMANVEAMREEHELAPEVRRHVDRIAASGARAAELTRRLLAFSRKQRLNPEATDINALVSGTGSLLRRTLGERVDVELDLASDLWATDVDRAQLEAALVNLCVNARDAMPDGGRLRIETANMELDEAYAAHNPGAVPGRYVMLSVSDTGAGIPAELLDKVFEPFFTTKPVGKGTGLGLSMVYGFIKQSRGHIKIYSEEGRGTTIRLYLPRSDATVGPAAVSAPPAPGGTERILLVEDDTQVRATVATQLAGLGYRVTEAKDAREALDVLAGDSGFDLMLTDVVMPGGLEGPALAERARAHRSALKVIFMSGYSEANAMGQGLAADARLLSKPFHKLELARALREALDADRAPPTERPSASSEADDLHPAA
jgi:PAS domain S-box-containing protein